MLDETFSRTPGTTGRYVGVENAQRSFRESFSEIDLHLAHLQTQSIWNDCETESAIVSPRSSVRSRMLHLRNLYAMCFNWALNSGVFPRLFRSSLLQNLRNSHQGPVDLIARNYERRRDTDHVIVRLLT
jgi:hypothetical protein